MSDKIDETQDKSDFQSTKDIMLDHYHCTLFLPLIGLEKTTFTPNIDRFYYCHDSNLENGEAAGYYYFSPAIRNILYDCPDSKDAHNLNAIKEWRLPEETIKSWKLWLDNSRSENEDVSEKQETKVTSVRLLQYFNGLYLLAVKLEPLSLYQWRQNNNQKNQDFPQLILEDWLHFSRLVRLIYPSFDQQTDEKKIAPIYLTCDKGETIAFDEIFDRKEITLPKTIGENFSPVMSEMIKAFAKEPKEIQQQITENIEFYDDRMFVSVAYSIAGDKLANAELGRINTLVSHVDRQQDIFNNKKYFTQEAIQNMQEHAYTPEQIQKRIEGQSFKLWEGLGSYYTFTDFSNTYLSNGWDFKAFIATEHIPHIYDRMLIQALFYQASLRHYDNIICESTKELTDPNKKLDIEKIKQQRAEFIKFTNQYWFHKLTEQMQGKEIFALQQKGLGVQEHYEILKDEIERTDEYLQTKHDIKENKTNSNIAFYGLWFALLALWYTVLPILNTAFSNKTQTLWQIIGCRAGFTSPESTKIAGLAIAIILPAIVIPLLYKLYKSIKKR